MKSLIIFVTVLAIGNAQTTSEWEKCKPQFEKLETCMNPKFEAAMNETKSQVKKFMDECKKCFDSSNGKCAFPEMHPPTPSPQAIECYKNLETNFGSCMKNEMKLSANYNITKDMEKYKMGGDEEEFGHFRWPSENEIKTMTLKFCNNNETAAEALRTCGEKNLKPFEKYFASLPHPLESVCRHKEECSKDAKLTAECEEEMKNVSQAFCTCRKEGEAYFNSNDLCKSVREPPAGQAKPQDDQEFDFCKLDLKKDLCAELKSKGKSLFETAKEKVVTAVDGLKNHINGSGSMTEHMVDHGSTMHGGVPGAEHLEHAAEHEYVHASASGAGVHESVLMTVHSGSGQGSTTGPMHG